MTKILLWILAIFITLAAAIYQRKTGPTYPVEGQTQISGSIVNYNLGRSHGGDGDQPVVVTAPDTAILGILVFRRYKADDAWTKTAMIRENDNLVAYLPHQPPAGKLEYHVLLQKNDASTFVPEGENVVTRFKGAVPSTILIPHILFMFLAMLFSTRAGLEALRRQSNLKALAIWTVGLLFVGGMILGPLVQLYAFGAAWTGFPFGTDLTDNKTLIAMIFWLIAFIAVLKTKKEKSLALTTSVLAASAILFLMYLIPHSRHGSELDYSELDRQTQQVATMIDKE